MICLFLTEHNPWAIVGANKVSVPKCDSSSQQSGQQSAFPKFPQQQPLVHPTPQQSRGSPTHLENAQNSLRQPLLNNSNYKPLPSVNQLQVEVQPHGFAPPGRPPNLGSACPRGTSISVENDRRTGSIGSGIAGRETRRNTNGTRNP